MNYKEVKESATNFGAGLRFHLGQQPKGLITIYAETRAEWMISCFGAYNQVNGGIFDSEAKMRQLFLHCLSKHLFFFQNIGVGTVYINLGDEGVIHAINETRTSVVITSQDLLPKLLEMAHKVTSISS